MFFDVGRFEKEMNNSLFGVDYEKELARVNSEFGDGTQFTLDDIKMIDESFGNTDRLFLGREIKFRPHDSGVFKADIDLIYPLMLSSSGFFGGEKTERIGRVFVEEGETPMYSSKEGLNGLYGLIQVQFYKPLSLGNEVDINPGGLDYVIVSGDGGSIDNYVRQDYEFKLNLPILRNFRTNRRKVDLGDKLPSPQAIFGLK